MSDLSVSRAPAVGARLPRAALLYAAVGAAGLAGVLIGRLLAAGTGDMEWQLVLLLRFMAAMKFVGVLAAAGVTHWRFGLARPDAAIAPRLASAYLFALGLMATAPGLIFTLGGIALGALLFHIGLLAFLLLAWKDDGARLPSRRQA